MQLNFTRNLFQQCKKVQLLKVNLVIKPNQAMFTSCKAIEILNKPKSNIIIKQSERNYMKYPASR